MDNQEETQQQEVPQEGQNDGGIMGSLNSMKESITGNLNEAAAEGETASAPSGFME